MSKEVAPKTRCVSPLGRATLIAAGILLVAGTDLYVVENHGSSEAMSSQQIAMNTRASSYARFFAHKLVSFILNDQIPNKDVVSFGLPNGLLNDGYNADLVVNSMVKDKKVITEIGVFDIQTTRPLTATNFREYSSYDNFSQVNDIEINSHIEGIQSPTYSYSLHENPSKQWIMDTTIGNPNDLESVKAWVEPLSKFSGGIEFNEGRVMPSLSTTIDGFGGADYVLDRAIQGQATASFEIK